MKKILIIANLHHASPRIPSLANYLGRLGWRPYIVTPTLSDPTGKAMGFPAGFFEMVKLLEVPYRGDVYWLWRRIFASLGYKQNESITEQIKETIGVKKRKSIIDLFLRIYQTALAYPDAERTWIRSVSKHLKRIMSTGFDVVMSSSPAPSSHIIASRIKSQYNLPWVADFRDTWTQNPVYPYPAFRKKFEERLERRTMSGADLILTVSEDYAKSLEALHGKQVQVISNGYTVEAPQASPENLTRDFSITYTGNIYPGKQDPSRFFKALRLALNSGEIDPTDLRVRFYGKKLAWLAEQSRVAGVEEVVHYYGTISREETYQRQQESQLLLFFGWEDMFNRGLSHLKFYEYLGARRPILACGGYGEDSYARILASTGAGVHSRKTEQIRDEIINYYREFKHKGFIANNVDLRSIRRYSYRDKADSLARLLGEL